MQRFTLTRDFQDDRCTLGRLGDFHTLERPWLNNQQEVSCVPARLYVARRRLSPHFGYEVFELQDVPDRTHIEIHRANYVKELLGCIALGVSRDLNVPAVWNSKLAFSQFMYSLEGINEIELEIINEFNR